MNKPRLSIVTVCYNAAEFIERTLQSVQSQDFQDFEHIVIDGASKDNTLAILARYPKEKQHILSEPDKGLYDAMNKGIRLAKGEYICFLNAGDTFFDSQTLTHLFSRGDRDVFYGEAVVVNDAGEILGYRNHRTPENLTWKSLRFGMTVSHQAFFIKRSLCLEYDTQYRICADIDWMINCLKQCRSIENTHQTLIRFLEGGLSSQRRKKAWSERYDVLSKQYGWLPNLISHVWIVMRYAFRGLMGK